MLNRRAGLHAYFVHSAAFLREGGRLGFVVPNGWLDVAYGEALEQFLLDDFKIVARLSRRWSAGFRRPRSYLPGGVGEVPGPGRACP